MKNNKPLVSIQTKLIEARRDEIASNGRKAKAEEKSGKLKFSSSIKQLKKLL